MIEVRALKKSIRNGNRTIEILKQHRPVDSGRAIRRHHGRIGKRQEHPAGTAWQASILPPRAEVLIDGIEISHLPEDKLAEVRGRKLGFVFQSFQLIPTLTALENVLLPHELNGGGNGRATAADLLRSVGLADRMHHYPIQLSGGEQQRVALARAFVCNRPSFLPTNPPAISIPKTAPTYSICCSKEIAPAAQPWCW